MTGTPAWPKKDAAGESVAAPPGPLRTPVEYTRVYSGRADQIRDVRAFLAGILRGCPVANDAVLIGDELATNAVRHSSSGDTHGQFTVHAEIHEPDYLWIEVEDQGGPPWAPCTPDGEAWHGLSIVREIAGGDANWGIDGTPRGWVVWVRLNWTERPSSAGHTGNGEVSRLCVPI
jgi:anti-sigma regulatory factor (Ser/Thr protein kinase)